MQEDLIQVEKNPQEILLNNIKLIPLHSVQKNGSKTSWKIFESWEVTALRYVNIEGKVSSEYNYRIEQKSILQTIYNGEFDPGSGWTLAAGLIHASRGAAGL